MSQTRSKSSAVTITYTKEDRDNFRLTITAAEHGLTLLSTYTYPNACEELSDCAICRDNFRDTAGYLSLRETNKAPLIARFLSYSETLSTDNAIAVVDALIGKINADFDEICSNVSTKGDKVLSRWRAFKPNRRATILAATLPDGFPEEKWAHLDAFFTRKARSPVWMRDKHRTKFLLPFLDPKAMAKDPWKLLQLIEMRRLHVPADHAWNDHEGTAFGRESGMLALRLAEGTFSTQAASYGKPVAFEYDAFHRWESIGFPTAEILFEAQHCLYRFLRDIIRSILEEATAPILGYDKWPQEAVNAFKTRAQSAREDEASHRAGLFYIPVQHFQPPPVFDADRLLNVMRERLEAIEGEHWLLQTDVIAAHDTIKDISESEYFTSLVGRDQYWAAVACELAQPLLLKAQVWHTVGDLIQCVRNVVRQQSVGLDKSIQLAVEIDDTISHAHDIIEALFTQHYRKLLRNVLLEDGALDEFFSGVKDTSREVLIDVQDSKQKLELLQPERFKEVPLIWTLVELSNHWLSPYTARAEVALNYLDDMLAAGSQDLDKDAFQSSRGWDAMIDFSAALWLMHQLKLHRPRFRHRTTAKRMETVEAFNAKFDAIQQERKDGGAVCYLMPLAGAVEQADAHKRRLASFVEAGKLLMAFQDINISSRGKSRVAWLETAREARAALDKFWKEVRTVRIRELTDDGLSWLEAKTLGEIKVLEFFKDREFPNSVEAELNSIKTKTKAAQVKRPPKRPSDDDYVPQTQWGSSQSPPKRPRTKGPEKSKEAKKAKGVEGQLQEQQEPVPPPPPLPPPPPPPKIPALRASLKIFARLWPNQSGTVEEGTVRWNHFQAAMDDIGLHASPVGGSRVSFAGAPGSILFHAPHGSGAAQLNRRTLLKYGRRLSKHFDWTYDTFEERT